MYIQLKNFIIVLTLTTLGISCGKVSTDISVTAFAKAINEPNVQLVDVRTLGEFEQGHLKNALCIDWNAKGSFLEKVNLLDPTKKTLVYCKSGARSAAAAAYLVNQGFKNLNTLEGGITSWQEAKLPIE